MSKLGLAILLVISTAAATLRAQQQPPSLSWAKRLDAGDGKETVTNLQFYFHDIISGSSPTAVQIVQPASAGTSTNRFFGAIVMADDPLTVAADRNSNVIGRAQGMYGSGSQADLTLVLFMSFSFTEGPYAGSSFNVMGRNPILESSRELPVLGGAGKFRMARGYALLNTVSVDPVLFDAVVHYNVTVYAPAA